MTIRLPEKVRILIETLEHAGFEAYAVGGCVRDSLLGRVPSDWDVTTSAKPEEVKRLFRHTIDTGIRHGTVTVLLEKEPFEVTTYRIDGVYEDGRHPKEVHFSAELREDLKRRDFTINAMAYNETAGLVDLFGGLTDLNAGVIRCVGDPEARFSEDALRIMRAVRFAAQLGFEIEADTLAALSKHAERLSLISAERIRTELTKLLISPHPEKLAICYETGQTAVFLPEFDRCMETEQVNKHHLYTVGEHTLRTLSMIRPEPALRLTMLLHDVAKPVTRKTDDAGVDHFPRHPKVGAEMAGRILRRLKYDNKTIDTVLRLIRAHDDNPDLSQPEEIRRAIARCGTEAFPALFEVKRADAKAKNPAFLKEQLDYIDAYEAAYQRILKEKQPLKIRDLAVDGGDLIEAGLKSGPQVGEALRQALSYVLTYPERNTKEQLLERLRQIRLLPVLLLVLSLTMTGCGEKQGVTTGRNASPSIVTEAAAAVTETALEETAALPEELYLLTEVSPEGDTFQVKQIPTGEKEELSSGKATLFCDKYGGYILPDAFIPGEPVRIQKEGSTLLAMQKTSEGLMFENLRDYEIDTERGIFSFEGKNYKLSEEVPVYYGDESIRLREIETGDELTVWILDHDVLSVRVNTGYGSVILKNTDLFDGGYLNLDNEQFFVVSPGMEIPAKEGKHEITVANDGYGDTILVNVLRDEALAVDLSALQGEGPKSCMLTLLTEPEDAEVLIDGKKQDQAHAMEVRYGTHRLTVRMEGYTTFQSTLVSNSETATIEISLTPENGATVKSASSTGSAATGSATSASDMANQITEAARTGTRPGSTSASASTAAQSTGGALTRQDFDSAYLDTLTNMFTTLANGNEMSGSGN